MNEQLNNIVLFHHAGGNGAAMNTIAEFFSTEYNIVIMEMAGRGRRRQEKLMLDAKEVVDDFASRVPTKGRLIMIGHSLGAYMAYLLASYLRAKSPSREILLVIISNDPIHCRRDFTWLNQRGEPQQEALWQFANKLGKLPDWLKQNNLLGQQFLQILAADLEVANSIQPTDIIPLINIPLLVIHGENDPYLPFPPIRWKECSEGVYRIKSIPGGHFIQSEQCICETISHFISDINKGG